MTSAQPQPSAPVAATASAAPDGRAVAFRSAEPGTEEQVDGGKLLLGAYAMVWVIVLVMVVRIFRRQTALARSVRALEDAVAARKNRGDDA